MSVKHPIISVTGSSGAGTTSVKRTFARIFDREGIDATFIEGDAFHRYNRMEMRQVMAAEAEKGNNHFSHFGPDSNLLEDLEAVFRDFGETGTGKTRVLRARRGRSKNLRHASGYFLEMGGCSAGHGTAVLRRPARRGGNR